MRVCARTRHSPLATRHSQSRHSPLANPQTAKMLQIANRFSFLLFVLPTVVIGIILLLRTRRTPPRLAVVGLIMLALASGYFLLRPGAGTAPPDELGVLLVQPVSRPVLLEIFSNYCVGCLRAEPVVDGLRQEWGDAVEVVRLNINEPRAAEVATRFNFQFTPTFILFTADGQEVWRQVGGIDPAAVRSVVDALLQNGGGET